MTDELDAKGRRAKAILENAVERNRNSGVKPLSPSTVSPGLGLSEAQEGWDFMDFWHPRLLEDEEKWCAKCMEARKYPPLAQVSQLPFYALGGSMRCFDFKRPKTLREVRAYEAWSEIALSKRKFELFGREHGT